MARRMIGYLTDNYLELYGEDKQGWHRVRGFTPEEAQSELPKCLDVETPLHLLADVIEMEFRQEKTPFVRGRDRLGLHQRKLVQAFRVTPYRHAFSLGRDAEHDKEERLLLTAVTNPELIQPWLMPLRERNLPVSGIAGVPLLLGALLKPIALDAPHLLVVYALASGSLRISYFHKRELRFSRLAVHEGQIEAMGSVALEECLRTHQYLVSLRLIERSELLSAICLLPEHALAAWQQVQPPSPVIQFHHQSVAGLAERAGYAGAGPDLSIERLLVKLLQQARFPNHFLPGEERHDYHVYGLRRGLRGWTGAVGLSALVFAGANLWSANEHREEEARWDQEALVVTARVATVRESFPSTDVPLSEMREALSLTRSLQEESAPTRHLLADVSRGFDAVPEAELIRLYWARSPQPEKQMGLDEAALVQQGQAGEGEAAPQTPRWFAIAEGVIVHASTVKAANEAADRLARAIQGEKRQAEVIRYPLNVRSDMEMKEELEKPVAARLPFSVRVVWTP